MQLSPIIYLALTSACLIVKVQSTCKMYTSGWSTTGCHPLDNEKQLTGADIHHCGRPPVPQDGSVCCGAFKCSVPDSAPDGKCSQRGFMCSSVRCDSGLVPAKDQTNCGNINGCPVQVEGVCCAHATC